MTDMDVLEQACRNAYAWEAQRCGLRPKERMRYDLALQYIPSDMRRSIRAEYDRLLTFKRMDALAAAINQEIAGNLPSRDAKGRFLARK